MFVTDHPNQKQSWMNFSLRTGRSHPVAGELISETLSGQFLCTGVRWFDLVGAVGDLLPEKMIQLECLKFGCSCPEMMEPNILREVRKAHGRTMTLDLSRGDFGEGRIGRDSGSGPSEASGPPGPASSKPGSYSSQQSSSDPWSKVCHEETAKFQLGTRKIPFHNEATQILDQVVQKCCKIAVFEDVKKFWTMP